MYQASSRATLHHPPGGQQMPPNITPNHPSPGQQMPPNINPNHPSPGQQMPPNINPNHPSPGQQMPPNINPNHPSPGQQMPPNINQNHPSPGQQMPPNNINPNYSLPGQQMPPNHQNYYPSPVQQMPMNINCASPVQQMPMNQNQQAQWQQQYAQPGQQQWQQNYQQQQHQYYQQNNAPNAPQYNNPVVAPPFQPVSPHVMMSTPLQPWSSELFDCSQDPENCLITAFMPCVTFGQIADITDRGMTSCVTSGLIYGLLLYFTGFHWLYSFTFRQKLRAQYALAEDPFHDCLVHAFCDPCALCQEYRELKNRGFVMEIGWAQNMQMQAQMAPHPGVPPPIQTMGK